MAEKKNRLLEWKAQEDAARKLAWLRDPGQPLVVQTVIARAELEISRRRAIADGRAFHRQLMKALKSWLDRPAPGLAQYQAKGEG